jgi:predicted amidophosphoribosyltransferase
MPNNSPNKIGIISDHQNQPYYTATFCCSRCDQSFSATTNNRSCPTCGKAIASESLQFADAIAQLGFKQLRGDL